MSPTGSPHTLGLPPFRPENQAHQTRSEKRPTCLFVLGGLVLGLVALVMTIVWLRARPRLVKSTDSASQIIVPSDWEQKSLNPNAVLGVSDPNGSERLFVLTEAKLDLAPDMTLDSYAEICIRGMQEDPELTLVEVSHPDRIEIGGRPALQYDVSARVPDRIHYVLTFIEGPKAFHELVGWTHESTIHQDRRLLVNVTATFREL